jgi:hypothetical protein
MSRISAKVIFCGRSVMPDMIPLIGAEMAGPPGFQRERAAHPRVELTANGLASGGSMTSEAQLVGPSIAAHRRAQPPGGSGAKSQILGAGSQDDTRLLRRILDRSGLCVGARKSF